jgi:hypothetical protein
MPRNVQAGLGLGPPAMDPMLHYQLASMYGAGARERLEMELERDKRERELRELREREISDRFKEEMLKNGSGMPPGMGMPGNMPPGLGPRFSGPIDPHWLDLHRRYSFDPIVEILVISVLIFCWDKSKSCKRMLLWLLGERQRMQVYQYSVCNLIFKSNGAGECQVCRS